MNPNFQPVSAAANFSAGLPEQLYGHQRTEAPGVGTDLISRLKPARRALGVLFSRSPHSRQFACAAFCATVLACVAAAAVVANQDLPLMLGRF